MLYHAFEFQNRMFEPVRDAARLAGAAFGSALQAQGGRVGREMLATWEMIGRTGFTHTRPDYGITRVRVGNRDVAVTEVATHVTPFGTLLNFRKDTEVTQPKVLLVAPLSGHFATLLRNTAKTLLQDHDVFITDWHSARDVPWTAGRFGFDEYVEHLIDFLHVLGPGAHVVAVCQPCVQALAATAVMAQAGDPDQPRSLTLMAGPVDVRINPTKVNELAFKPPLRMVREEPDLDRAAALRRRRPARLSGFLQLIAFLSMNRDRHIKAHLDLHGHLVRGETRRPSRSRPSTTSISPCWT
jgi:poly(3-hydroxybutyrate) depolymerase